MSKLLLRFRSPIFRKTDSPYDSEFGALSEYSQYHKPLLVQQDSRKLATDENTCLHHQYDIGEQGVSILCILSKLFISLIFYYLFTRHSKEQYVRQTDCLNIPYYFFIYLSIYLFIYLFYLFIFIYLFYLFFILFIYLFIYSFTFFCTFIFILHNSLNIAESSQRKTRSYCLNF